MREGVSIEELIERLEKANGPDRELDLGIRLAVKPSEELTLILRGRKGFDSDEGVSWELRENAVVYQRYDDNGVCWSNGGITVLRYTASIDAAMTLVPEGWKWALCLNDNGQYYSEAMPICDAVDLASIVDGAGSVGAIALCIAALKARAHKESSR